jgi:hypothetical protein
METYDHKSHLMSGGRYPVLKTIAILYLIGGVVVALYGLFVAAWCLFGQPAPWIPVGHALNWGSRIMACITALGLTFFGVISMLAIAEGIKLFIDGANSLRMMAAGRSASSSGSNVSVMTEGPAVVTASDLSPSISSSDGKFGGRLATLEELDAETAEGALLRGH